MSEATQTDELLQALAERITHDEAFQHACQRYHHDGGSSYAIAMAALRVARAASTAAEIVMPARSAAADEEPVNGLAAETIDVIAQMHTQLSKPENAPGALTWLKLSDMLDIVFVKLQRAADEAVRKDWQALDAEMIEISTDALITAIELRRRLKSGCGENLQ
jgi:hypothetical protein